jgi:hypothetical protein
MRIAKDATTERSIEESIIIGKNQRGSMVSKKGACPPMGTPWSTIRSKITFSGIHEISLIDWIQLSKQAGFAIETAQLARQAFVQAELEEELDRQPSPNDSASCRGNVSLPVGKNGHRFDAVGRRLLATTSSPTDSFVECSSATEDGHPEETSDDGSSSGNLFQRVAANKKWIGDLSWRK